MRASLLHCTKSLTVGLGPGAGVSRVIGMSGLDPELRKNGETPVEELVALLVANSAAESRRSQLD